MEENLETLSEIIKKDLQEVLDEKRYIHTLGVVKSAIELSKKYGVDEQKSELAALLHDYAKNFDSEKKQELKEKYNVKYDKVQEVSKQLQHAIFSEVIAKYKYNIKDEDVLNAIRFHTTGRNKMSKLEMVVCLADYIEENRDFPGVDEIRRLSKLSLEDALYYATNNTIIHLCEKNVLVHKDSLKARNYFLENCTLFK